jgi:WD40 repeat protein
MGFLYARWFSVGINFPLQCLRSQPQNGTDQMTTPNKQIFISYSRVDTAYARALADDLAALGFTLWRDRSDMEGGENWWQQIEEAIRGVDTMLLLLSEAALASKIVSKEWRYARQVGTRVIPVIADSFAPERAPRWMSKRDWYDFRRRAQDSEQQLLWEKMIAQLRAPYQRKRVPFMAEDLPADFVLRGAELGQIIPAFIDETREEPRGVTVALKGAGGYGKTTLARAVCADERIQAAFDDGILWVTFGEKVDNLTGKVDDLVYVLTGKHSNANTLETAVAGLVEALDERDILIVLDDVWDAAHLKPFLQGGERCARLITTRDAGTLPSGTQKVAIDEMARSEAVTLLRYMLPNDEKSEKGEKSERSERSEKAAFEKLAERLGYWPLLIKLVNGALRDAVLDFHQPLSEALADMNQGLNEGGLTVFDTENTSDRSKAVRLTIELSLSRLSAEERERFAQLVIFPEDVNIPLDVVGRLWALSGMFTRKLCGRLFNMSLLLEFDLETGTLRLHDIVRDYLMKITAPGAEGAIHEKLLDSYRLARWSDLPETDRYLWEHLGWHMIRARRAIDLIHAITDIQYLAKKSIILNPAKAEADLIWLETRPENEDNELPNRELRQQFTRITHILNRCQTVPDAAAVIWNRATLREYSPMRFRERWANAMPMLIAERPLPDLPTPALFRTLDGHRDSVKSVAFSPDGKHLVSTGDDRTVRLWQVETGQSERDPIKVGNDGCAVAWSSDGSFIVAGFRDGSMALYDVEKWTEQTRWQAHDYQVRSIAIHPDNQRVLSGGRDNSVKVWDRAGKLLQTYGDHATWVEAIAYSPDGSLLASSDEDGLLIVRDANSGAERYRLMLPKTHVYCMAFSGDGKHIAAGCNAGKVAVWELATGAQKTLHAQSGNMRAVAFNPNGGYLISCAADASIVLWKMADWTVQDTWLDHSDTVRSAAWSPDGAYIATGANDRSIKLWSWVMSLFNFTDTESDLPDALHGTFYSVAYAPDGRLVVLGKSRQVFVFAPENLKKPQFLRGFHNDSKKIACSANWILGLNDSESIKRWEARTGQRSGFLVAEAGATIHTASYSPDEQTLIVTTQSNTLEIRSAHNLAIHQTWAAPDDVMFRNAAYSPDGQTIVAAADDGAIWLWSPGTGATRTLTGHVSSTNEAAYSPDGKYIASASSDRTLRVWDAMTGNCLHTFHADGGLYSLAWHPDGAHIVAAGARGIYWLAWKT